MIEPLLYGYFYFMGLFFVQHGKRFDDDFLRLVTFKGWDLEEITETCFFLSNS